MYITKLRKTRKHNSCNEHGPVIKECLGSRWNRTEEVDRTVNATSRSGTGAPAEVHHNTVHKMKAKVCLFSLQNLEPRRNNTRKYVHRKAK